MLDTPVLIVVFKRAAPTLKLIEALREIKPSQLYVSADGPRKGDADEFEKCALTRKLFEEEVDWDCKIVTRFLETNMGCAAHVSTAISWAFQEEEKLIILEDDCIPHPTFFGYCEELLSKYAQDTRVMHISGTAYCAKPKQIDESYFFSNFPACWGWATWKRSWDLYSFHVEGWDSLRKTDWLSRIIPDSVVAECWANEFDQAFVDEGTYTTWDFQWGYSCWANSGLSIFPRVNLVKNVGFGEDASHMHGLDDPLSHIPTQKLEKKLLHPKNVRINPVEEKKYVEETLRPRLLPPEKPTFTKRCRRKIKRILVPAQSS